MVFPPDSKMPESHHDDDFSSELLALLAVTLAMHVSERGEQQKQKRHNPRTRTLAAWQAIMAEIEDTAVTDGDSGQGSRNDDDNNAPRVKRRRRVHPRADFRSSPWAVMLRSESLADSTSRDAALFRGWFRVPHVLFLQLVELTEEREWFALGREDVEERQCIPAELKVLAALHILGRGTSCLDDVCRMSLMTHAAAQATFHKFTKRLAQDVFSEHVRLPEGDDQDRVMAQYDLLGFTGAIGSTDVMRVRWGNCPSSSESSCTGKEEFPVLVYQATVDHAGRALTVTKGFSGSVNDKTVMRHDKAMTRLRYSETYAKKAYHLRKEDGTLVEHRGNYSISDNENHKWKALMPPTKYPSSCAESIWSAAMAVAREDIRRFFGTLKGRFRILKLQIPYEDRADIDNMFLACCTLHNMLHSLGEGLDKLEPGEDWGGEDGLHDPRDHEPALDESSVGHRGSPFYGKEKVEKVDKEKEHFALKEALIAHYNYRLNKGDIGV